jgi:hypothetical protein
VQNSDNGTRYNATAAQWGKVDWPLDDMCNAMYPGSRAATMLELTTGVDSLWTVPGCKGAHEGEWPLGSMGPDGVWLCSYASSGSYRWSLPPNSDLHNITIGNGE